jgi:hypothetical protein
MTKKRKSAKTSTSKRGARTARVTARKARVRAAKPRVRALPSARRAAAIAVSPRNTARERVAAMAVTPSALCDDPEAFQGVLNVLRDRDEPLEVRLAALSALQAASFSVVAFAPRRSDYIAALRALVEDPDANLRQRVLGILAREKDGYVQKKLLEGLENPAKALVLPEKALQLLGNDVHADAYKIARKILDKPPSELAKREALRLLAADTSAKPLLEKILRDKGEAPEYRRISASALQTIAPDTLQKHARAMILDTSESDDILATSLTAITHFGDADEIAADNELVKRIGTMSTTAPSETVKQCAQQFMTKYGY